MVVGGGRLETSLGQRARDLGWPVLASYGMTEAGSQIATQDIAELTHPYSPDSLSILPIWQLALSDQGIIEISGDALFHGYLHTTSNGLHYQQREGVNYTTNDRGVINDGKLSMECRADEIVKILGELVNPKEIERELSAAGLPHQRFAVIAIADERKGHRLVFVHENLPLTEITAAIAGYHQHAVGYARIEEMVAINAFPRSDLGKIRRAELIARYHQAM
jgi:O-succinylbenzoic acid--CoA ligase